MIKKQCLKMSRIGVLKWQNKRVKKNKIKARMVGTPETISAACGLSLRLSEDQMEAAKELLSDISFTSQIEIYAIMEKEDGSKRYELLNE